MRKITLKAALFVTISLLALVVLMTGAHPRRKQNPVEALKSKEPLVVLKKDQPDSPITISSITVDSPPGHRRPVICFAITNNSANLILTYTIKHEAVGSLSGSIIRINPDPEKAFPPGHSADMEISNIDYAEQPKNVTLSVDFVEFIGGTRWGPDTINTGDRLDGVKAGVAAAIEALTHLLMTEGAEGVIRSSDSTIAEADQTVERSAEWLNGFKGGVAWVGGRVRAKGQDFSEIHKELRRFDALRREWR